MDFSGLLDKNDHIALYLLVALYPLAFPFLFHGLYLYPNLYQHLYIWVYFCHQGLYGLYLYPSPLCLLAGNSSGPRLWISLMVACRSTLAVEYNHCRSLFFRQLCNRMSPFLVVEEEAVVGACFYHTSHHNHNVDHNRRIFPWNAYLCTGNHRKVSTHAPGPCNSRRGAEEADDPSLENNGRGPYRHHSAFVLNRGGEGHRRHRLRPLGPFVSSLCAQKVRNRRSSSLEGTRSLCRRGLPRHNGQTRTPASHVA